jgi:pimeloyl-ACP methyl ester carboxylesterase
MLPELRSEIQAEDEDREGEGEAGRKTNGAAARLGDALKAAASQSTRLPIHGLRALIEGGAASLDPALGQDLSQDLRGVPHALSYLRHLARGNRIRRREFFDRVTEDQPPVLLLHGFLGTRGSMYLLERRLIDDNRCVISFNLGMFNWRDIRASAFLVHRKIESILSQTQVKKIDIIGHSMGGLIGLYYVKKLGGARAVRKLVMMGTPQQGTWAALLGVATLGLISSSSWQLLPRSRFLEELRQGPLPEGVDYYTISAQRDWVCPPDATRIEGAVSITVPLGHAGLVMSPEVYAFIRDALGAPPVPAPATSSAAAR